MGRRRSPSGTTLAVVALVVGAPSCAAVIGVEDYSDATEQYCALLSRCFKGFKNCLTTVQKSLAASSLERQDKWLHFFADNRCLADCKSAYRCLDVDPLCKKGGAKCTRDDNCCTFSKGVAACDVETKHCCGTKGSACETDDDCCSDAGRCADDTKTCGGVVCAAVDAPCTYNFECCSGLCPPGLGACAACSPDGLQCVASEECCSGFCDPASGVCGVPVCSDVGLDCSGPVPCCGGLNCVPTIAGFSVCSNCPGLPNDQPCAVPEQCCSGYCHPQGFCADKGGCSLEGSMCFSDAECCTGFCPGGACQCAPDSLPCTSSDQCCNGSCIGNLCQSGNCKDAGATCAQGGECCSGQCNGSVCTWLCATTTFPDCSHDICVENPGAPLDPSCACDSQPCTVDTACVKTICSVDQFCCCNGWDSICVTEVSTLCGQGC